ncbi:hypothetical protein SDRG_17304, partial [Saprolegnia diclina VS20]
MLPITYFFIKDHKHEAAKFSEYIAQVWQLIQKRAMWQLMLFNFFYNLFGGGFSSTAAPYVQLHWAKVENLNSQIMTIVSNLIFACIVASIGRWGTNWNWRIVVVSTTLTTACIDSVVQFCTFYDVLRNQWFYLGVPLAEQLPQGVLFIVTTFMIVELAGIGNEGHLYCTIYDVLRNQWFYLGVPIVEMLPQGVLFIVTTFVIVELAEIGNEGIVYGLLTTVSNLPSAVGPVLANQIYSNFRVDEDSIISDTDDARNQVAYTYMIYYAGFLIAACTSYFLPSQKLQLHELQRNGGSYPVVGGAVLIFCFCMLVYSI